MLKLPLLVFAPPENSVLFSGHYDFVLVGLSILVATLASYASLLVSQHLQKIKSATTRRLWLIGGGLCLGLGIWAMHFVGMLAFSLPCTSNYDSTVTFLSMLPSFIASTLAIRLISRKELSRKQLVTGGLLIGAGIGAMHYSGMAAMHFNGMILYNFQLFLLSLVVAVVLATFALWIKFKLPASSASRWSRWNMVTSSVVLGLAVSGMHYTAMASAYFIRGADSAAVTNGIEPALLAAIVLAVTSLIIVVTIVATFVEKPGFPSFGRSFRLIGLLIIGWSLIAWLTAEYYYQQRANEVYQHETKLSKEQADNLASNIDESLKQIKNVPLLYSHHENVLFALRHFGANVFSSAQTYEARKQRWLRVGELRALNAQLSDGQRALGTDMIFVINAAGDCVAASNATGENSPVGINYTDREYFQQAKAGQHGHQYVVSRSNGIPGLYYSAPVFEKGHFLGAVVAKRDITKLSYWTNQAYAFIADSNGVIVLAPDKRFEFHWLPKMSASKLTTEMMLMQYKRSHLEPLEINSWKNRKFPLAVTIGDESTPSILSSKLLSEDGISIYATRSLEELPRLGHERFWLFILLATIGSMLIITATTVMTYLRGTQKAAAESRIAATAFESQEGMFITDANNLILRVNQAVTEISGYSAQELIGKSPSIFSSGCQDADFFSAMWQSINNSGSWEGEILNRRKSGEVHPEYLTITAVKDHDGIVMNYVATISDKTTSKAAAEEIKNLAYFDPLTHLPNRRLMIDRLQQALALNIRSKREGALLFIDLDDFKSLNDSLGHDYGDLLLQQVAQRLKSCVREGDTVARFGGDEFVVMLENLSEHTLEAAEQTEAVGQKIIGALNQSYLLNNFKHHSTPSIGATLFGEHSHSTEDLLKQADIAMYQAKKSGRNMLCFFDPEMQSTINARSALEGELRLALEKRQLHLYYQIQVDSLDQPIGAETLIRWIHPERGVISPLEFIPLAEETGLIIPIGNWVLNTACAQLKIWQQNTTTRELLLSVNVSAKQFRQDNFADQVREAVQRHEINPKLLKLELTESMLLENIEGIISSMKLLKEIGVRISLDDFGTGYSSLQYLKRLPIDQLKIDRSFVRDIAVDNSDKAIVSTIIAMSKSLNLEVIAEGVETEEQRLFLLNSDCLHYQGFLFGKPLPIDEFEKSLKRSKREVVMYEI